MAFSGPLEDRLALRELLETYGDAVCRNDAEAWGGTWTEDARWQIMGQDLRGRSAIVAFWKQAMASFTTVAFTTQPRAIAIDGDRATLRASTVEGVIRADGTTMMMFGAYEDDAIKREGRWQFTSRSWTPLVQHPQGQLL